MRRRIALELSAIPRESENNSSGELFTDPPPKSGRVNAADRQQTGALAPRPTVIGRLFLTVEEAAQRLGVTSSWMYERTRRKAIPHRKLGKFVRFTEEDLLAIVEAAANGTMQ
jgi:excisionase family DNA binding protein